MSVPNQYLYRAASDVPYFSADADTYLAQTPVRELRKSQKLRVLSEEDFAFWQSYGYIIVPQAISAEHARKLLDFAWDFQGLDPERPETWYREQKHESDLLRDLYIYGFVEAYQHQLIWDSRQAQRVYEAFVDVWDCEELWVTLDRLNLNPPNRGNRDRALIPSTETGFDIDLHWDVDTTLSVLPQRIQGIIALNDTEFDLGGFQCNPTLFHGFEKWRALAPQRRDPIRPDVDRADFPVERPQLKAGDLLIWNGLLAHGVAPNQSANGVRAVQYLSMMPAIEGHRELVRSRVESWRTMSTPEWNGTLVGAPVPEAERYPTAELTELGAKLLGLKSWREQGAACAESA
jgi:ectoine hydroxylase-related dioxygenase (phytanoyl-CoA dioxygenase family)